MLLAGALVSHLTSSVPFRPNVPISNSLVTSFTNIFPPFIFLPAPLFTFGPWWLERWDGRRVNSRINVVRFIISKGAFREGVSNPPLFWRANQWKSVREPVRQFIFHDSWNHKYSVSFYFGPTSLADGCISVGRKYWHGLYCKMVLIKPLHPLFLLLKKHIFIIHNTISSVVDFNKAFYFYKRTQITIKFVILLQGFPLSLSDQLFIIWAINNNILQQMDISIHNKIFGYFD